MVGSTATATKSEQQEENPGKTLDQHNQPTDPSSAATLDHTPCANSSSISQQQPVTADVHASRKDSDELTSATDGPVRATAAISNDEPVSDTDKKIRRAERFGMPVQLSEEEKRNSRAERFGTRSATHGSDALKTSEEQKRKARAERFGLVQSIPADEEAKKKARSSRFAAVSKTDSLEEDKRKARAIRFSQPPTSSLSQVNGKGNIEKVHHCLPDMEIYGVYCFRY